MPFGTGPMGLGTPVTASLPPKGPAGSRYIHPATKDYERDPTTGQLKQMPKVRQQVLLALTTLLGSASTLDGFGIRLPRKQGGVPSLLAWLKGAEARRVIESYGYGH